MGGEQNDWGHRLPGGNSAVRIFGGILLFLSSEAVNFKKLGIASEITANLIATGDTDLKTQRCNEVKARLGYSGKLRYL